MPLGLPHHDGRSRGHALVEVDDVLVEQAHAARRHRLPDRTLVRVAVQAIERVLPILEDIEGAGARSGWPSGGAMPWRYCSSSGWRPIISEGGVQVGHARL